MLGQRQNRILNTRLESFMTTPAPHEITKLLLDWRKGDESALERLTPLIYDELRRLADHYLRREQPGHTLQATALVHEAYLQLIDLGNADRPNLPEWQNRAHFFGIAASLMRRILVDHARARAAAKRGGGMAFLPLDEAIGVPGGRAADVVALDDALKDLATVDERKSRIIELRYFGGLSIEETAEAVGISVATVRRELRLAEAWLYRQIQKQ